MLDLNFVAENIDEVILKLETRNDDFSYLKEIVDLATNRKDLIAKVDTLKANRNQQSKLIGQFKKEGRDIGVLIDDMEFIKVEIPKLEKELTKTEAKIFKILSETPNIPALDVPVGPNETYNVEIKTWGEAREFDFEIKDHVTLGEELDILDFEKAAKITGARFVVDKGLGARLERALINFMMDLHTFDHKYTEIIPPFIVNEESMYGTGQLPKFKEEAFKIEGKKWYLNPTAEVPTINMYKDQIITYDKLPLSYVSFTTAFRAEAGAAGKDTRGILRQHQFNKVELIKFSLPEESEKNHQEMLSDAEKVLQLLKLPYRVMLLSSGDLGFSMKKTYDLEVWIPSQNTYREIASISNAGDFQARRANIRFKRGKEAKSEFLHTLNGSGLAIGRTMIAILENYQNEDGTVTIPEVLVPYMKETVIKP